MSSRVRMLASCTLLLCLRAASLMYFSLSVFALVNIFLFTLVF